MASNSRRTYSSGGDSATMETPYVVDLEQNAAEEAHLRNTTVRDMAWTGITVTVKDRVTKKPKVLLDNIEGYVEAGELLAIMGPSGCGKTTLLNVLASRPTGAARVEGEVLVNGGAVPRATFRQLSRLVEQEDALIGSLTARETLYFASQLYFSSSSSSSPTSSSHATSTSSAAGKNNNTTTTTTSSKRERLARIDSLLAAFGLAAHAHTVVGTPLRAGLSGGQRRRVGIASQLVTAPRVLLLDEPTSGLDSAAALEVLGHLRAAARRLRLVVVATVHQPSSAAFALFDRLLLLSRGRTQYFGPVIGGGGGYGGGGGGRGGGSDGRMRGRGKGEQQQQIQQQHHNHHHHHHHHEGHDEVAGEGEESGVAAYFGDVLGRPVPRYVNTAEFLLDLVNVDFAQDRPAAERRLRALERAWASSAPAAELSGAVAGSRARRKEEEGEQETGAGAVAVATTMMPGGGGGGSRKRGLERFARVVCTLLHRSFIKSYRDVIAYGVRMAMYFGLAIMMGTVWLRLKEEQEYIQPYINAIFFGSAFMSFMAVAYVPAFLEDRAQYLKDHHNGLYGAAALVVSNFLIGLAPLLLIALGFSALSYWLSNLRPDPAAFFVWVLWVFLDLVAAESLVVLVASLAPAFVAALALVAFANGLWMCVGGFLVPPAVLNVFWRYGFGTWDYQRYVFEGMMVNEFAGRTYACAASPGAAGGCSCMYETALADRCEIAGEGVLALYGYEPGHLGKNVGIMLGIIAGYRVAAWLVLMWRR